MTSSGQEPAADQAASDEPSLEQAGLGMADALREEREDRYHRLKLIKWWDQDKLRKATVLVVGAGALGNELLKHLGLVGIGNVIVCDLDDIEPSNLSRSVLFRAEDAGLCKSETAAARLRELNPEVKTAWLDGDVATDIGLGVFRRVDLVLGGVDNVEARIAVNDACWQTGTPYIDGGTHRFEGQVRTFLGPEGPCYQCTLSAQQYETMHERMRCNLLLDMDPREAEQKVSTTSVAASIIAAIQIHQALMLLHDSDPMRGKTIVYNGPTHETYVSSFEPRDTDHHMHSLLPPPGRVIELPACTNQSTVREVLAAVREHLGPEAQLIYGRNVVHRLHCTACGNDETVLIPLSLVRPAHIACPSCGEAREHELLPALNDDHPFPDRTLSELGIPPLHHLLGYAGEEEAWFELSGDAPPDTQWEGAMVRPPWTVRRGEAGCAEELGSPGTVSTS